MNNLDNSKIGKLMSYNYAVEDNIFNYFLEY